ncbi:MAG: hypothetical protein ABSF84_15360 [Acidimicrobiales bacterium]|jgi:hypothetical protein
MSRLTNLALAASATSMAVIGLQAAPAGAATTSAHHAEIVGELGYEGGAAPGGFHPTAGTVQVEFDSVPLTLLKHVGKSGHFTIKLSPGSYTVIGCGPSATGTTGSECSQPQNVTLVTGEVDHIQLIWAYTP